MRISLVPHPQTPCPAVEAIDVEVARADEVLTLRYILTGDIEALKLPPPTAPARTDELWRHTCFEAFLRHAGREPYLEINLAPSTQWAAYRFDRYRHGMSAPERYGDPGIATALAARRLELNARLDLTGRPESAHEAWEVGLSAVIEAADGSVSYWALAHPPGKPDFHHADCFALTLAATEGS